jgi:hypothetical protein
MRKASPLALTAGRRGPSGSCQAGTAILRTMNTASPTRKRLLLAAPVLAVLFALPFAVRADKSDHVEARELLKRGEILPLSAILDAAARQVEGDVIEVELEHEEEGWQYEVKVLTAAGEVRKLVLDARNARVLKIKAD